MLIKVGHVNYINIKLYILKVRTECLTSNFKCFMLFSFQLSVVPCPWPHFNITWFVVKGQLHLLYRIIVMYTCQDWLLWSYDDVIHFYFLNFSKYTGLNKSQNVLFFFGCWLKASLWFLIGFFLYIEIYCTLNAYLSICELINFDSSN